jgi:ATP-dependent Clp protease ATP-binding subunit ClpA
MVVRLGEDARKVLLGGAAEEARRRGDRRLGTDHLLIALLNDDVSGSAKALGVDLDTARAAEEAMDQAALAAIGIDVQSLGSLPPTPVKTSRRWPPLTSGARAVLKRTIEVARSSKTGRIEARDFLLALLECERPDPAAELLHALGIDSSAVRARLSGSEGGPP